MSGFGDVPAVAAQRCAKLARGLLPASADQHAQLQLRGRVDAATWDAIEAMHEALIDALPDDPARRR